MLKIRRALLSVSDKTGIVKLGYFLNNNGVEIISTFSSVKYYHSNMNLLLNDQRCTLKLFH